MHTTHASTRTCSCTTQHQVSCTHQNKQTPAWYWYSPESQSRPGHEAVISEAACRSAAGHGSAGTERSTSEPRHTPVRLQPAATFPPLRQGPRRRTPVHLPGVNDAETGYFLVSTSEPGAEPEGGESSNKLTTPRLDILLTAEPLGPTRSCECNDAETGYFLVSTSAPDSEIEYIPAPTPSPEPAVGVDCRVPFVPNQLAPASATTQRSDTSWYRPPHRTQRSMHPCTDPLARARQSTSTAGPHSRSTTSEKAPQAAGQLKCGVRADGPPGLLHEPWMVAP
jgi:hypothetical protein